MSASSQTNDQLVLIAGYSGTGKTVSLRTLRNQENWLYLNAEAGKRPPFKHNFRDGGYRISDPLQVLEAFDHATDTDPTVEGIIIDSLSFLMDMYESVYVIGQGNTMQGWSNYAQFFKTIMQQKVTRFTKPVIILTHTKDDVDERSMEMRTAAAIKGSLRNNGVEAYFSTVVAAKKMTLKELDPYRSDLLHISEEEQMLGFKYVFQTRITSKTVGERIRSPMGLFAPNETFIDNNAQLLLDHLKAFYAP